MSPPVRSNALKAAAVQTQGAFEFVFAAPEETVADLPPKPANDAEPGASRPSLSAEPVKAEQPSGAEPPAGDLAAVLDRLNAAVSDRLRRTDLATAIRSIGKALDKPLADIPTEPRLLAKLIDDCAPAAAGYSPKRWSAIQSRLRSALRIAGHEIMPGRASVPLTPTWRRLADELPTKRLRHGLSRLISFLSREGVKPAEVGAAHFELFRDHLLNRSLQGGPETIWPDSLKLWNDAVRTVPAWPQVAAELPADKRRYALADEAFAQSFLEDVDAFKPQR